MADKAKNMAVAKKLLSAQSWQEEYRGYFADDIVIDFFNAPPGMKQHMDAFEVDCCFEWLRRTVKSWRVDIEEFYGSPDGETFWSLGYWGGDVFWGHQDGSAWGKFIMRIVVKNEKISYVKMLTDPIAMLKAAGRDVPIFHMTLEGPDIDKWIAENPAKPAEEPALDLSPEACNARKWANLYAHIAGGEEIFAPGCTHAVWFLPPEMKSSYPDEMGPVLDAWTALSMKPDDTWGYHPSGRVFPTDDPHVFFCEYNGCGSFHWFGNADGGKYHNTYYYLIKVDDQGRMTDWEEFMDTMNKFNSINVSIPSFPYYL